jgi:hypothetical protein
MRSKLLFLLLLFLTLTQAVFSSGKIKGRITDSQSGEPLIGANVVVTGTSFGAATDVNGEFLILNLSPGVYELRASFIGYQTMTLNNIRVYEDLTTESNFQLPPEGVTVQSVTITALRPLVNKSNTNANRISTADDIEALPVRGLNNILALTPGVNFQDKVIFVRGGRQDEVGFYLEGANITNPLFGGRKVSIIQDAIEEIQVQAGGYTAEYGGANAGIIYSQLKSGTADYKASVEYTTDNITFKGREKRYDGKKQLGAYWYGYSEFTGTFSGPVVDNRFKLFGLINYQFQADNNPQAWPGMTVGPVTDPTTGDSVNFIYPAGALQKNSLNKITGTGTFTMDFNPFIFRLVGTYSSQTTYNPYSSARVTGNIPNMLNLDRTERVDVSDGAFSLKATHILSPETYYEITAGYSLQKTHRYDPFLIDDIEHYGDSVTNANLGFIWTRRPEHSNQYSRQKQYQIYDWAINAPGDVTAGYQKARNENFAFNAAFSTVLKKTHSIKVGGELQLFNIRNYSLGNEGIFNLTGQIGTISGSETKEQLFINQGVNNYGYDLLGNEYSGKDNAISGANAPHKPVFAAGYIQDKIEYNDLIINVGFRFDYIDVDNKQLKYPLTPDSTWIKETKRLRTDANGNITGLEDVPSFNSISPRLGFSFPVTDKTVFHAQYGKFVQQSRLRDIYQGWYATAYNLGGGFFIQAPVGFNVRPTRTTQYEIGFTQQIGDFASFDITGYYKDIQDQIVYDQIDVVKSKYGAYATLTNGDFATTKGLEISFNMRRQSRFQLNGSISLQDAQGTGSYPNSNRGIIGAPLDGVTRFKPQYISPLEFNNAFRGSLNLDYRFGVDDGPSILQEFGASILLTFNSGHPYTIGTGGASLEVEARDRQPVEPLNASTTPWNYQVDLRVDKTVNIFDKLKANIYIYIINLFDTKNYQNVFMRTGSAVDDGFLTTPSLGLERGLQDPTYAKLYRAMELDYLEQWQTAITGAPYTTAPNMYGPPRQIRLGIRLEY